MAGLEPAASASRTQRATKLRHTPWDVECTRESIWLDMSVRTLGVASSYRRLSLSVGSGAGVGMGSGALQSGYVPMVPVGQVSTGSSVTGLQSG